SRAACSSAARSSVAASRTRGSAAGSCTSTTGRGSSRTPRTTSMAWSEGWDRSWGTSRSRSSAPSHFSPQGGRCRDRRESSGRPDSRPATLRPVVAGNASVWPADDVDRLRAELGAVYRDRTVLVTGADGFMGSHLVDALVHLGARVHAFVRATSSGALN